MLNQLSYREYELNASDRERKQKVTKETRIANCAFLKDFLNRKLGKICYFTQSLVFYFYETNSNQNTFGKLMNAILSALRIITGKKPPKIKLQRLRKIRI